VLNYAGISGKCLTYLICFVGVLMNNSTQKVASVVVILGASNSVFKCALKYLLQTTSTLNWLYSKYARNLLFKREHAVRFQANKYKFNIISSLLKKYADKCRNLCTDVFIGVFQNLCGLFLNVTHAFRFVFAVLLPLSSRPPYSPLPTFVSVFVFSHPTFSIPIFPFPGCDYSSACLCLVLSTVI
jgi:hypothetical protein